MASAYPDDDGLHAGRTLGPYELLVPVGSGGMAHVWAARHRGTHQIFALKMLREHLADNPAFREMFFDEARIASMIRHENVCVTYDLVELDGILTLVMEWVDGTSLMHVLKPGDRSDPQHDEDDFPRIPLPLRPAVRIVSETCAGLHAAHDLLGEDGRPLGVVHRDVSPHNVLLTLDGRVKVTDFGVAKALGKLHMTIAGQVKGKLAYMSPEQLVGDGVDRRSDVFALGTVLYEITTGGRPFQGEHDPEVMSAIVMGDCLPPSAMLPGYPAELEHVVLRAMATDPNERYATAWELRDALERWLAMSGPMLGPPQIAHLLRERCGRELGARAGALAPPVPRAFTTAAPMPVAAPPQLRADPAPMPVAAPPQLRADPAPPWPPSLPPPEPERGGLGVLGIVLAIIVGGLLGAGVLLYLREHRRPRAALPTTTASFVPAPSVTAPPPPTATTSVPAALPPAVHGPTEGSAREPSPALGADAAPASSDAPVTATPPVRVKRVVPRPSVSTAVSAATTEPALVPPNPYE